MGVVCVPSFWVGWKATGDWMQHGPHKRWGDFAINARWTSSHAGLGDVNLQSAWADPAVRLPDGQLARKQADLLMTRIQYGFRG